MNRKRLLVDFVKIAVVPHIVTLLATRFIAKVVSAVAIFSGVCPFP